MGFKLKAADGTVIEVPDGEYYFNTKARGRRMMGNSLSADARRVYACLELATMGWQQELAVIMEGGKQRPLTPTDVRQQTGLRKQHVSRALAELEDAGLAKRESDDNKPLQKGHIQIYSWAVPRSAYLAYRGNRARLPFPDWFPQSWEPIKSYISRNKYSLIEDEVTARGYFEEVAAAARRYQEAEMVLARALEKVCARPKRAGASLYERTERTIERTPSPTDRPLLDPVATPEAEAVGRSVEVLHITTPEPEPPKAPPPETKPLPEIGPLAADIRKWLVKTYALPTAPSTEVLAELARLCRDGPGFDQFKDECAKTQNADPKTYRYFLPIARRCAEHRPEYEEALQLKKEAKPITNGFDEERVRRLAAQVEEDRKWR
jgi:DNA-binding transcriptional ArsR family regulator